MILKAAILQKDSRIIYTGHRHNDCFLLMRDQGVSYKGSVQGFVDSEGNFLNRREAYLYALSIGQIKEKSNIAVEIKGLEIKRDDWPILTSEDLY